MFLRRQRRQRQKAETGQRGNRFTPFDEARQRQPQPQEFGVAHPNPAHRDQSDSHLNIILHRKAAIPPMVDKAGMKNRWRNTILYADR